MFPLASGDAPDRVTVPGTDSPAGGQAVMPARLGRYELIAPLAVGATAELYLGRQGELAGFRTPVLVKRVLPALLSDRPFLTAFLDEARIAAMLDHPNVVRVLEVGRAPGELFVAMELVQGKPF